MSDFNQDERDKIIKQLANLGLKQTNRYVKWTIILLSIVLIGRLLELFL